MSYLGADLMRLARAARPTWAKAGALVGVPAEIVGGIHYRENEFGQKLPGEAGGPLGFDPGYMNDRGELVDAAQVTGPDGKPATAEDLEAAALRAIRTCTAEICNDYGIDDGDVADDFFVACVVAAHELKRKLPKGIDAIGAPGWWREALWRYNGAAAWHTPTGVSDRHLASAEYSSYVSNDPANRPALLLVPADHAITQETPAGDRVALRGPVYDHRPGAWIIYHELVTRAAELA